jgi:hypothetical protein
VARTLGGDGPRRGAGSGTPAQWLGPLERAARATLRAPLAARATASADGGTERLRDALAQLGEVIEACEMEQYRACRDDLDGHPVLLPDTLRDRVAHALAVTHAALPHVGRSAVLRAYGIAGGARVTIPTVADALLGLQDLVRGRLKPRGKTTPLQEVAEGVVQETPLTPPEPSPRASVNGARRRTAIPDEVRILAKVLGHEGVQIDGQPVRILRVHALEDDSRLILGIGGREQAVSFSRLRRWIDDYALGPAEGGQGPRPVVAHRALAAAREGMGLDMALAPHELDARLTPKDEIRDMTSRIASLAEEEIPNARRRCDGGAVRRLEDQFEELLKRRHERFANYHGQPRRSLAEPGEEAEQLGLHLEPPAV